MAKQSGSLLDQPDAAPLTADVPPELLAVRSDRGFFGHPRGLSTLFFTEMWERFSCYGSRPMLIAFMIVALSDGGVFGFDRPTAGSILGIYASSVYLTSLPGGWIAERWLGLQRAVWWGGVLIAAGHLSVALSGIFGKPVFFLGLVLIVMGTGLLKPNISAMVGDLYADKGARRDAGFSVFYMGINLGATLGPLVTGGLRSSLGYHYGFGAAGIGMIAGIIWYSTRAKRTLGPIGAQPRGNEAQQRVVKITVALFAVAVIAII